MVLVGSAFAFPAHAKSRYKRSAKVRKARRVFWNPILRGSHDSLLRQNAEIDRLQLARIANDDELTELVGREELVRIYDTHALKVSPSVDESKRYCRPWTLEFLKDLSEDYYAKFKKPLMVTSAVRTVEQQAKLRRTNRNAAPIEGETASSHLAGLTIDIGKRGMSRKERRWFDQQLLPLQQAQIIEAAEERRQACYHIMVTERYLEWRDDPGLAKN